MARIRTIKPEFWRHPVIGRLPDATKLLAIALLNMADDEGYFHADPIAVRNECRPYDDDSRSTTVALRELSGIGYVVVRDNPEYGPIGRVCKFAEHQVINKPTKSKISKYFNESGALPEDYGSTTVGLPSGSGSGKEVKTTLAAKPKRQASQQPYPDRVREFFESITDEDLAGWAMAYPALQVGVELFAAKEWLLSNPANAKSNFRRFLTNWLKRAQEKAPRFSVKVVANHDYMEPL